MITRVTIGNSCKEAKNGYEWTFYVRTQDPSLIKSVVVHLHPTFSPNKVTIAKPPFTIKRMGWGTFEIKGSILFHDNSEMPFVHELSFSAPYTERVVGFRVAPKQVPHALGMSPMPHNFTPNISPMPMSPMPGPSLHPPMSPMPISPMLNRAPNMSPMPMSPMPSNFAIMTPTAQLGPQPHIASMTPQHQLGPQPHIASMTPQHQFSPTLPGNQPHFASMTPQHQLSPSLPVYNSPTPGNQSHFASMTPQHQLSPPIMQQVQAPSPPKSKKKKKKKKKGKYMTPQHPDPRDFVKEQLSKVTGSEYDEETAIAEKLQVPKEQVRNIFAGFDTVSAQQLADITSAVKEYRTKGHVLRRGLFAKEEILVVRHATESIMQAYSSLGEQQSAHAGKLNNVWKFSDLLAGIVFSKRLTSIVGELMGIQSEDVRVYHDQLLMKRGNRTDKTTWHQDALYFPFENEDQKYKVITAWIPLIPVNPANGAVLFASGSHLDGFIERTGDKEDLDLEFFNEYVRTKNYELDSYVMEIGDVSFHSGLLLHAGYPNQSPQTRKAMSVIFYAKDMKLGKVDNVFRQKDYDVFWEGDHPIENKMLHK
eukprot:TRINITY_DN582_c0_g1_i1.p1 TRINITY_DN582_c0_g1~~TRINITY_DN582_c0_g1_i1.p1  ORF type:complete len:591 (-),score=76.33 TRINITY_DN582_c0_g1_i1:58-1830(-)